jgi:hypothetical protein
MVEIVGKRVVKRTFGDGAVRYSQQIKTAGTTPSGNWYTIGMSCSTQEEAEAFLAAYENNLVVKEEVVYSWEKE